MRNKQSLLSLLVVCCTLAWLPGSASAGEPVVANRLYDLGGRLEVSLTPVLSIFDKYTMHVATAAGLSYYFNDYIGMEVEGGYAFVSQDRKLLNEILDTGRDTLVAEQIQKLPLSDLKRMTWFASGGLVINPLYGKLNLSAEVDFNFHFYLALGGGVGGFAHSEFDWATSQARGVVTKKEVDLGATWIGYFGGGIRMHFAQAWSLRLEIRDYFTYDKFTPDRPTTNTDKGPIEDFVHITAMRIGVCYSFF